MFLNEAQSRCRRFCPKKASRNEALEPNRCCWRRSKENARKVHELDCCRTQLADHLTPMVHTCTTKRTHIVRCALGAYTLADLNTVVRCWLAALVRSFVVIWPTKLCVGRTAHFIALCMRTVARADTSEAIPAARPQRRTTRRSSPDGFHCRTHKNTHRNYIE